MKLHVQATKENAIPDNKMRLHYRRIRQEEIIVMTWMSSHYAHSGKTRVRTTDGPIKTGQPVDVEIHRFVRVAFPVCFQDISNSRL